MKKSLLLVACSLAIAACAGVQAKPAAYPTVGAIDRSSPALDALIAPGTKIEKIAGGFQWSEGPVWIDKGYLLFSDVPQNKVFRWSEKDGASLFLSPSGFNGTDASGFREPGSNGLIQGPGNSILMGDDGNRAIAQVDLTTKQKKFLATNYQGKKFNSPNDLVRSSKGIIYFTDPPYGLKDLNNSPLKELSFNGVYRLDPDGTVTLVDDSLTFPNGIMLSPDQRTLYVSNSDPKRAIWMAYQLDEKGNVTGKRLFADMTADVSDDRPGMPDGMAVDTKGNIWASGPGGIIIFSPQGGKLGLIRSGKPIANSAFGEGGHVLYMTSSDMILRIPTLVKGIE